MGVFVTERQILYVDAFIISYKMKRMFHLVFIFILMYLGKSFQAKLCILSITHKNNQPVDRCI